MKFQIKHSTKGRLRVHLMQEDRMTLKEAEILRHYLQKDSYVKKARVYERTEDVTVFYAGSREHIIQLLKTFHYEDVELLEEAKEQEPEKDAAAIGASVLSVLRDAGVYSVSVKDGKFFRVVAEADTILFDKAGTLTKGTPTVARVYSFCKEKPEEMLRLAACLGEQFHHYMAGVVVEAAEKKGLFYDRMHAKVENAGPYGIAANVQGKRASFGEHRFVFEEKHCKIPYGKDDLFQKLPVEDFILYLALDGNLAAAVCIEDPVREEAGAVVSSLKKAGLERIIMLTEDDEKAAEAAAGKVGIDTYFSGMTSEDKADFVKKEKKEGRRVLMVGNGIHDLEALSAADAGIVFHDGTDAAKGISDIVIENGELSSLVSLKHISDGLMKI